MFSLSVQAQITVTVDNIEYKLYDSDKSATLTNGRSASGDVVIPAEITHEGESYKVVAIGDYAFYWCFDLTSITISEGVEYIGCSAFEMCSNLSSITIPESVTFIDGATFSYCTELTSIKIPNSVTSIGRDAFFECTSLTSIDISCNITSIGNGAFGKCSALKEINSMNPVPPVIYYNTYLFVNKNNCILNVPIGSKRAYSNADYWQEFININEVEFPDVTSIEDTTDDVPEIIISNGSFVVSSVENTPVCVYSTNGNIIYENNSYSGENISLPSGMYIVKTVNGSAKAKL